VLPEQLQGPGWAVAWSRMCVDGRRCALRAGLAGRLLDPRDRQREGFRSGGHGWFVTAASRGRRNRNAGRPLTGP
jgi:hypothetical protein